MADERQFNTRELANKNEEITRLVRHVDQLSQELKKSNSQLEFTKSTKQDIEQRYLDLQKDYDLAIREKKSFEKLTVDLREENVQFFKNEERVKRLIDETE